MDRALGHAAFDDWHEEPPGCRCHRRQHAAPEAWTDRHGIRWKRPDVVQVRSDGARPPAFSGETIPGDDTSRLAAAEEGVSDDDGRCLEVVVTDVVLRHLVVPEESPAARIERKQGVRVRDRPRIETAVRVPGCTTPRIWVRDPDVEMAVRC